MNYELLIFCTIILCSIIILFEKCQLKPRRKNRKRPAIVDYAFSFFPILLMVFSVRSFAYEPWRIPSGSLKPTIQVGDFILVNKFTYGIRLPIVHTKIINIGEPQRGDIVVFRSPSKKTPPLLIKRVIGIPGDQIKYVDKVLYINGQQATQSFINFSKDSDDGATSWPVEVKQENLLGIKHGIYQIPTANNDDFEITVPPHKYFMMGDNRDDSADSRYWGFMPEENIVGKATRVLISFDKLSHPVRLERTGEKII